MKPARLERGHSDGDAVVWMETPCTTHLSVHYAASQSTQAAQAALRDARADADGTGSSGGTLVGWGMSPSGRFQALLVAARHRGCLQAHYEAMLERCHGWC